jgi:hypothetical protein
MTDAYKIGITVALSTLVSAELLKIITHFGSAEKASLGFAGKLGIVAGAATIVVAALTAGVEEARKFQIEATKFASLGFGDAINTQAQAFAKGMDTLGTSATENMALVGDAMAVFKNLGHAEMAAPLMAKMKFANAAVFGAEGEAGDRKFMDMLKVIEFRGGLSSDQEFDTQANFVQKVIAGSRNRVDARQLLMALKTGGVSLARLSNEAFYLGSEPLIQEFGGSRYGTANMSAYQNLVMMRTTQQAMSEMMRLGLLDPSKVEMNTFTGKVKRAQAGAFKGANILGEEGDLAFLEKVLLPAFAAKGITSDQDVIMEIGRLFTNRTASGLFSRIYQQRGILHTQIEANKNAMDINQLTKAADGTLDGKLAELSTQWKNLKLILGDEVLPGVIWGIGKLAVVLKDIGAAIKWLETTPIIGKLFSGSAPNTLESSVKSWKSTLGFDSASAVPPAAQQSVVVDHKTTLDGRVLAKSTTEYQVRGLAEMPSSGSSFDGRLSLAPVN